MSRLVRYMGGTLAEHDVHLGTVASHYQRWPSKKMSDKSQALASLRFLLNWSFVLIGVPALLAALGVGLIVGQNTLDGYAQVIAAGACTVADVALDASDLEQPLANSQRAPLDAAVHKDADAHALQGLRLANSDGLIVYSTLEGEVGETKMGCLSSPAALEGVVHVEVTSECCLAAQGGRVLTVSAPLHLSGPDSVDGVLMAVEPYDEVWPSIRNSAGTAAVTVLGAALVAFVGMQIVVRRSIAQIERDEETVVVLNDKLVESTSDLEAQTLGTLMALLSAVDAKDSYTAIHSLNVSEVALAINCHLDDPADATELERAALLHDIGKIGVSETILSKPGKLTEEEWAVMRDHCGAGAEILRAVPSMAGVLDVIRHHHERWDGKGYPDGLCTTEIPLEARILAIADTYDAMTTERPYSDARSPEKARAEIEGCAGTQFDPVVVEAFFKAFEAEEIRAERVWRMN